MAALHQDEAYVLARKLLQSFHAACDIGAIEIAVTLYEKLEKVVDAPRWDPDIVGSRPAPVLLAPRERLMNLVLWQAAGALQMQP